MVQTGVPVKLQSVRQNDVSTMAATAVSHLEDLAVGTGWRAYY